VNYRPQNDNSLLEDDMKGSRFLTAAALTVFLGGSIAVFAQQPDEHPADAKPPRQEESKPETRPDEAKPPRQDEAKPQQDARPKEEQAKPDDRANQDHANPDRMKPEQRADEHAQPGRPAGKSARIPDDKFRSSFGRQHTFKVSRPVVVGGQSQFAYGGYTFVFVDPWPVGWAYTDDCYVDYIDGEYFLFDLAHPGVRIALIVNL
jgi:hypothetical protein